jgi:lambda family phage portal protein
MALRVDAPPATVPNLIDRVVGWISPRQGLMRHYHRQLLTRAYLAAAPGDGWRPRRPGASANADHQADSLAVRTKSRFLVQNVEYIAAGMNARVAHGVGTGIVPKWGGRDGPILTELWKRWSQVCDADGLHDIYGLQAMSWRTMDVDGEVLVRFRPRRPTDGLPVPLQIQLLEVDWLDTRRITGDNGNVVIGGKEYDALGKCVGYWLYDQHPGDMGLLKARGMSSRRVPADQIIHLYAPTRPGQGRGFGRLASVITRARDLQLLEDAEMARKNLEARLGIIASGDVASLANPAKYDGHGMHEGPTGDLGQLASGGITQIPGGMNVTVVEPKAAPGFVDHLKHNIHLVCSGAGFTYEQATGDMKDVSFVSSRMRMLDFRREIEQTQWLVLIPILCDRICREFVRYAELSGAFQGRSASYTVEHATPRWEYVNPKDDIDANLAEVAGGMSSISQQIRRRGDDPAVVFSELEADIKDLKRRGIWDSLTMLLKGKEGDSKPVS